MKPVPTSAAATDQAGQSGIQAALREESQPSDPTLAPIGVFDSGVGGLTVARAIIDQLPQESILYVGDTARGPYGPLQLAEVRANALDIMDQLVEAGVKQLVIACNTASAAVLHDARERYTVGHGIPVVEVIKPAVRAAVRATHTGRIGVIGTQATIRSRAYEDAFAAAPHIDVSAVACPRFVEFVERGETSGPELLNLAQEYLQPLKEQNVDSLVLGCTHYPLLTGVVSYVMGEDVSLVSSADETAKDVFRSLTEAGLIAPPDATGQYTFMATGDTDHFSAMAQRFLGPEVTGVTHMIPREHDTTHQPHGARTERLT